MNEKEKQKLLDICINAGAEKARIAEFGSEIYLQWVINKEEKYIRIFPIDDFERIEFKLREML